MHPRNHALAQPDKLALIIEPSGESLTYAELDIASNRAAQLFRAVGLQVGDRVALCMENRLDYHVLAWGAQRAGLYLVAISSRLTAPEIGYILSDSGARMLIASPYLGDAVLDELAGQVEHRFLAGGVRDGWEMLEATLAGMPDTPIADERAGTDMLYSSGTTGRPKGVLLPLPEDPAIDGPNSLATLMTMAFGVKPDSMFLSPAPLYHAAPLRWTMCVHRIGGTVVVMDKFDAEATLALIEKHRITDAQFVPTHFIRMLKLPDDARAKYDHSSMKCAVHAAAPCPVPVKLAMIDWWGPVLAEYYAGSEGSGFTFLNSADWLTHQGSVGRALLGIVRIVGDDGEPLPARQEGTVYFEAGNPFRYHNDPDKTAEAFNDKGWSTLGDVGWQDEEGFLYLTDRKSFMIISGGVNIYPQEIENWLVTHPRVADAAVIGAPDEDMGEKVVAVIQPMDMAEAGDGLRDELSAFLRQHLSGVKMPRQIDFRPELPRHPTGKLYKRLLRDEYWGKGDGRIV